MQLFSSFSGIIGKSEFEEEFIVKKAAALVICSVLALSLVGCGKEEVHSGEITSTTNETVPITDEETSGDAYIDFGVQYIRTDGYSEGEEYPKAFWITSVKELEEYYDLNKEKYFLESIEQPASDRTIGFVDAVKKYDDAFFEKNDLIFALLEEGSGSIRHEVTGVKLLPSHIDRIQYYIQPEIKRIVPEIGTDDMAEWHIIIEVSKDCGMSVSELKTPIIS